MTRRRVMKYVDALIEGRRTPHVRARSRDAAIVRTAILLKQANAEEAAPREEFVSSSSRSSRPRRRPCRSIRRPAVVRPLRRPPVRVALGLGRRGGRARGWARPASPWRSTTRPLPPVPSPQLSRVARSRPRSQQRRRSQSLQRQPVVGLHERDVASYTGPVACGSRLATVRFWLRARSDWSTGVVSGPGPFP